MSFGWSTSDIVALSKLCYRTIQNARKACGEYDSLTQEVTSLHALFKQLEKEKNIPGSVLNLPDDSYRSEIEAVILGCKKDLLLLEKLLEKYNALGAEQGGFRKLRHKVRFGNGKMADLPLLRAKISYYNSILHTQLQLISMKSASRIEKGLRAAEGDLNGLRKAVENLNLRLVNSNDSPLTPCLNDDTAVWKAFRRELLKTGYSSTLLQKHGERIRTYCEELVADERPARSSPNGSAVHPTPNSVNSRSTMFYTPEESFQQAILSVAPPVTQTMDPETTLEDAIAGPQHRPFKLPPPALPVHFYDPLAVEDLSPGGNISLVEWEASAESASKEEASRFTLSDMLFSSVFGGRRIPYDNKEPAPEIGQDEQRLTSYLDQAVPARKAANNGLGSVMMQRFLQKA